MQDSTARFRNRRTTETADDIVLDITDKTIEKLEHVLLSFDLLDGWMQDNKYILTHYRPMSRNFKKSFASVFQIHNETVNIWTHMIPGFLFVGACGIWSIQLFSVSDPWKTQGNLVIERYQSATRVDGWMIFVFLLGASLMFTASWTFHTVCNHSLQVASRFNKLDYVGIICMILGSFFPSVYYGHYCEPQAIRFYLVLLGCFGFLTFCFTILDRFRTPAWRPYRAGMFIALGLSAIIPVIDSVSNRGWDTVAKEMSLWHCIAQGTLYIIGACTYASRVPEKYFPRTFDVVGSSHQIFHCCVILAGFTHALGIWRAFNYRHGELRGLCRS